MVEVKRYHTVDVEGGSHSEVLQGYLRGIYQEGKEELESGRGFQLYGKTRHALLAEYREHERYFFWEEQFMAALREASPSEIQDVEGRYFARSHEEVVTGALAGYMAGSLVPNYEDPIVIGPKRMREFAQLVYPRKKIVDNGFGFGGPQGRSFADTMILVENPGNNNVQIAAVCEISLHADWEKVETQYKFAYKKLRDKHPGLFTEDSLFWYMVPKFSGLDNRTLHTYISRQAMIKDVPYTVSGFTQFFGKEYSSLLRKTRTSSYSENIVYKDRK